MVQVQEEASSKRQIALTCVWGPATETWQCVIRSAPCQIALPGFESWPQQKYYVTIGKGLYTCKL